MVEISNCIPPFSIFSNGGWIITFAAVTKNKKGGMKFKKSSSLKLLGQLELIFAGKKQLIGYLHNSSGDITMGFFLH
jgi:hypothetical protein